MGRKSLPAQTLLYYRRCCTTGKICEREFVLTQRQILGINHVRLMTDSLETDPEISISSHELSQYGHPFPLSNDEAACSRLNFVEQRKAKSTSVPVWKDGERDELWTWLYRVWHRATWAGGNRCHKRTIKSRSSASLLRSLPPMQAEEPEELEQARRRAFVCRCTQT